MSESVKRGPGRPKKIVPPVHASDDLPPSPLPAAVAVPSELASPVVVKALDDAGLHNAAHALGAVIADPDQAFRDEVRNLCKAGMPVTFHLSSLAEAAAKEQIVREMETPGDQHYVPTRRDSRLEVALRSKR